MKKNKTTPKKSLTKKPVIKKVTKKSQVANKKTTKISKSSQASLKKTTKSNKTEISKPSQVKTKKSFKTAKPKTSKVSSDQTIKFKKNPNGMNHFQQCVVLAALINQKRHQNPEFQTIPLPEITSSLLEPLREYLSQYAFNSEETQSGLDELTKSSLFKKTFPVKDSAMLEITLQGNPKKIMGQLLELAGPEARKIIYLKEEGNRFLIHRTTLEKYALKTGQLEGHAVHHDTANYVSHESTHKEILNQINQRSNPRYYGQDHAQNFSTKQRRGRG